MSVLKSLSMLSGSSRLQMLKKTSTQFDACRTLFSAQALALDNFENQREKVKTQLTNIETRFRSKMQESVDESAKHIIFTEDLKNMIHIAEEKDTGLVVKMMKKFNSQNRELRFGNFIFGPVVMRMFYLLNKSQEALDCYKSPELEGFFDQMMSYQLLLDLLHENTKYNDVLEVYDTLKTKQIDQLRWARNLIIIVMASCYKLNTPESLKYALDLWTEMNEVGHFAARRAATFTAALALNQKKPEVCIEILSSIKNQNYTTVRNLKVSAYVDLNLAEDIVPFLKSALGEGEMVQTFNKDVIDKVTQYIEKVDNKELKAEFENVMKYFKEHGNISETTLDSQLSSEIQRRVPRIGEFGNNRTPRTGDFGNNRTFDGNNRRPYVKRFSKPKETSLFNME